MSFSKDNFEMMSLMTGLLTVFNVFNLNYVEANKRQGGGHCGSSIFIFAPATRAGDG